MSDSIRSLIFLFYGLAFFAMGLIVLNERGRGSDERLRHALLPLAVFGLIHGLHEWQEMLALLGMLPAQEFAAPIWEGLRLGLLAFSFLSLAAFGASLLSPTLQIRRVSLLLPLFLAAVWAGGLFVLRGRFTLDEGLLDIADTWSRYTIGIPASLVAAVGLVFQQRAFRRAGMEQFGRDSLWAALAFLWYGPLGQIFTRPTPLWPSTVLNQNLFLALFGFPVQLVRAAAAITVAIFIVRSLRSFEVENERKIKELQAARLAAAEEREALRGELLRRIVAAQEAERQRIARELHDETGQKLTAIGLGLRSVTRTASSHPRRAAKNLQRLEDMVADALTELQRLIADLRPSHLDDLGLPSTLRWYAGELEGRAGLPVSVVITGRERALSAPVNIALFRVAQEALTNVVKHAIADAVVVGLCYGPEAVTITVSDDGQGFDVQWAQSQAQRAAYGLLGMRERAELLGGQFDLTSTFGQGSQVRVTIPYQAEASEYDGEARDDHSPPAG